MADNPSQTMTGLDPYFNSALINIFYVMDHNGQQWIK